MSEVESEWRVEGGLGGGLGGGWVEDGWRVGGGGWNEDWDTCERR